MKKHTLSIIVSALLFIILATAARAQSDFEQAYSDYVFQQDIYEQRHSEYLLARSQYLQAETLASQTKAVNATISMLQARDDVVISYLTLLRRRLEEAEGINETEKNGILTRVDNEVVWYQAHRDLISSAGTLEDLEESSDEARERYGISVPLAYEVLAKVAIGKEEVLRRDATSLLNDLKDKTSKIRQEDGEDTSTVERWIIETENKLTRSLDKSVQAQVKAASLQNPEDTDYEKINVHASAYNSTITTLVESHQFLKEASNFMKEVIRQIFAL